MPTAAVGCDLERGGLCAQLFHDVTAVVDRARTAGRRRRVGRVPARAKQYRSCQQRDPHELWDSGLGAGFGVTGGSAPKPSENIFDACGMASPGKPSFGDSCAHSPNSSASVRST